MEIGQAVSSYSALASANTQAAVSVALLKKSMELQESTMTQLLQALPQAAPVPGASVGGHVNTYA